MNAINVQPNDRLLRTALRGNGIFSLISGALFILLAQSISEFLGIAPDAFVVVALIGVGLLGFSGMLFWLTSRTAIATTLAIGAIVGDVAWVIGSIALLVFDPFQFSTAGRWAILIIADAVGIFAILQFMGLCRSQR